MIEHVGIFRFRRIVEILRRHQKLLRRRIAVDFVAIKTGIARLLAFGLQQHRFVRIDPALFRIESNVTKRCQLFPAHAVGQVFRATAIGRDLPDVVTVVDQNVFVVFGPTGDAVRTGR